MELIQSAHAGNICLYRKQVNAKTNIQEQLKHGIIQDGLEILRQQRNNVKFIFTVKCIFEKALRPGVYTEPAAYFKTSPIPTTHSTPLKSILQGMFEHVWEQIESYVHNGSGWVLRELLDVDMQVCEPLLLYVI